MLRVAGHDTIAMTLTGLAERADLLSPEIGLDTHVADVVSLLNGRNLRHVTLVGHSYGGTVITAVAEQVPDRVRCVAYLDASVPQDGESNNDVLGPEMAARIRAIARMAGDGWRVPSPPIDDWNLPDSLSAWVAQRLTPHPLRSLEQPVRLQSLAAAGLRRAFLRSSVRSVLYGRLMDRARRAGWHCRDLTGGHYPMFTAPGDVAAALRALAS